MRHKYAEPTTAPEAQGHRTDWEVSDEELRAELQRVQSMIDVAYWNFTRQSRGVPPVLAVPEAYERRSRIRAVLRSRKPLS